MPLSAVRPPELLAPAGDFECMRAAVANGADAVYFGLDNGFNARARATNFSLDGLPDVMRFLHRHGVKGYVTLNTLVFGEELVDVERTVRGVAAAGVDAVLVQDLGLARLVKGVCAELPIHASTQMTLTSAEGIRFAESLGVDRVVLARELSLENVRQIRSQTEMPLEVFVHGALCVAYSGQCLTSESLGGRSANRGQCAQACRMTYELVCDGEDIDLGEQKYLLSPQDLAAFDLVPELIAAGVSCFKIEGRLKTPEYVANITRHYRQAIDAALAGRPVEFSPRAIEEMELSFSRGFSHGWLDGDNHKRLVPGLSSAKRGVYLGQVTALRGQRIEIQLAASVKPGDGIVFAGNRAAGEEQGGRVYELFVRGQRIRNALNDGRVELALAHGAIDVRRIWPGQQVWKTDDPELSAKWKKSYTGDRAARRVPIDVRVTAKTAGNCVVEARRENGPWLRMESPEPLVAATKHPLSEQVLQEQLGRLGGTSYEIGTLTAEIVGGPMVPLSVLGALRHEMVRRLDEAIEQVPVRQLAARSILAELTPRRTTAQPAAKPALHVLCRSLGQLRAAIECGVETVYADFQDIREYADAVRIARTADVRILLATPRIQKPGEMGIFEAMAKHEADGMLARNLSGLMFCRERAIPYVADFSLNVTNALSASLIESYGAERLTASYDMNREQLLSLVDAVPAEWLEVVVHQHMPMFHMEHCVFCAVLSPGTDATNCGRPCDVHQVKLRDRIGMEHPLKADVGCRNTLFNAVPQSSAEVVPTLLSRGVRHFRIELLDGLEADDQPRQTIGLYRDLLAGRATGREVWSQLRAANRVGVTRGTLEERRNPLAIL